MLTRIHSRTSQLYQFSKRRRSLLSSLVSRGSSVYDQIRNELDSIEWVENKYELERHGRGESYHPTEAPDLIAFPKNVEEVRSIVKFCYQNCVPIIPFGAGTSLEGHVSALHGGISMDMASFQSIELPDFSGDSLPDMMATVGAGVTRKKLNEALRHTGTQFVLDPGADATLGGMFSTAASGTTAVQYGTMRENTLAVEAVLPDEDATLVKAGTRALKNSAGYDLVSLLCGSEGTLGVVTSLTVKLVPIPQHVVAATCVFDSLHEAAEAVATLKLSHIPVSRCELLDATSVSVFNAYNKTRPAMEEKPTLFLEFQGSSDIGLQELVTSTQSICVQDFGGSSFQFASDEDERRSLWEARHSLYHACIVSREGATSAIVTDACVPLSKFADVIDETVRDVNDIGVVGPCFGHAGDGNLHCILPVRPDDSDEYRQKLELVNDRLIKRTLAAGGTCTGEHGVGYGKIPYLERQYGAGAVHLMKILKKVVDPKNIMNPGKVIPHPFS